MKEPKNRDVLSRLYRMVEQYEEPPNIVYADDAARYFADVVAECNKLTEDFNGNEFALEFAVAFALAVERRFKNVNQLPLAEREPQQMTMI